jgi:hypothetical protein
VLADVELSRANQVADIFDEDDIQIIKRQPAHPAMHQPGIEVAAAVGLQLHHRDAQARDPLGVVDGGDVALQHGTAQLGRQPRQQPLQQGGFPTSRAAHDVDHAQTLPGQQRAIVIRRRVVVRLYLPQNLDVHHPSPDQSRWN